MNTSLLLILATALFLSINSQSNYPYLCLEYSSQQCIRCPLNTHVYQNQCYNNTVGCLEYVSGDKCSNCNTTYTTLQGNTCVPLFQGTYLVYGRNPASQLYPAIEYYHRQYVWGTCFCLHQFGHGSE
jgi:hypothetical protein